ncbi:hypothetical protein [Novosphingobium lindaniclasticum]|uniref:Uncharacterized protein n=1 Tax=Novosphingobium lindaniclasticum LE124 TaxID=1096930 RepID=T0IFE4_9SPHN|nr:hypothetical protein [Novosphingobium lindaniclasticum]EQB10400.1 hypothetical protein L284_17045 [Novosphingobium lindaniclasticum LE124]
MPKAQRKPTAPSQPRELIRRTTAMTDAMFKAFADAGFDVSRAKVPLKREPTWRVSRRG